MIKRIFMALDAGQNFKTKKLNKKGNVDNY